MGSDSRGERKTSCGVWSISVVSRFSSGIYRRTTDEIEIFKKFQVLKVNTCAWFTFNSCAWPEGDGALSFFWALLPPFSLSQCTVHYGPFKNSQNLLREEEDLHQIVLRCLRSRNPSIRKIPASRARRVNKVMYQKYWDIWSKWTYNRVRKLEGGSMQKSHKEDSCSNRSTGCGKFEFYIEST